MLYSIVLVIHVFLAIALIGMILIQKPEGGALGALGGGDNMNFLSGRSTGNFLTKTTSILAVLFIITSLSLAFITKGTSHASAIIEEDRPQVTEEASDDKEEEKTEEEAKPETEAEAKPVAAPISKE